MRPGLLPCLFVRTFSLYMCIKLHMGIYGHLIASFYLVDRVSEAPEGAPESKPESKTVWWKKIFSPALCGEPPLRK